MGAGALGTLGVAILVFTAACGANRAPAAAPSGQAAPPNPPAQQPERSGPPPSSALPGDAEVARILAERVGPLGTHYGIVVGLVDANGRRFVSHGSFDQDDARALDQNTLFELGSVSKVFTALLLQTAVERGEVGLDDPVSAHLPSGTETPSFNGQPITLRHLATHTSGLPRVAKTDTPRDASDPHANFTVEQLYGFLASFELTREPGSEYEYSNLGYALLARALIVRTGRTYAELVRERITDPLGMRHTCVEVPDAEKEQLATGHTQTLTKAPPWRRIAMIGNGGIISNASDMLTFLSASMGLVKTPLASAFEQIATAQMPLTDEAGAMALGWHIASGEGPDLVWHNGGTGGFRTYAAYLRGQGVGVVVLSNVNTPRGVDDIGEHLLGHGPLAAAGSPDVTPTAPRAQVAVASRLLDAYAGDYQLGTAMRIAMRHEGNGLWVTIGDKATFRLFAESESVFFMDMPGLTFRFETDPQGKATAVVLVTDRGESRIPRKGPAATARDGAAP